MLERATEEPKRRPPSLHALTGGAAFVIYRDPLSSDGRREESVVILFDTLATGSRSMSPMRIPRISTRQLLGESGARAALFDMDGVLADTELFHLEGWRRLLKKHTGKDPSEDLVKETFGQTNDAIIPKLWNAAGREPPPNVEELGREKELYYRDAARGKVRPIAGLERFLVWLRRRQVPTGIVTSGPAENIRFLLAELGADEYFDVLVDRSRFAAGKPAPDGFLRGAELLQIPPSRVLVFEDSVHGLRSARAGGFLPCAVATTLPEMDLLPFARWVIRDFEDIAC